MKTGIGQGIMPHSSGMVCRISIAWKCDIPYLLLGDVYFFTFQKCYLDQCMWEIKMSFNLLFVAFVSHSRCLKIIIRVLQIKNTKLPVLFKVFMETKQEWASKGGPLRRRQSLRRLTVSLFRQPWQKGTLMAKALLALYSHHICWHRQVAFFLISLALWMVSSSRFLDAKEGEMPQPMNIQHFRETVSSNHFWSQFYTELWLSLKVSETERFQLECMKIARKTLCDVLLPSRSQFISDGQGSHETREKVPHMAEPLLCMGEGGRSLKLL